MREIEVVFAGEVDHGKSSLVGRLIHECGLLSDSRIRAIAKASDARGRVFEWAFVTDAFLDERDRNITVDHCEISLRIRERRWVIVDTPGHHEFAEKLLAGASRARLAVVVVDPNQNTVPWFHINILRLMGIRDVIVARSKADIGDVPLTPALERALKDKGMCIHSEVAVSARTGAGLAALVDAIEAADDRIIRPSSPSLLVQTVSEDRVSAWATGSVRAGAFTRIQDGCVVHIQNFVQWPEDKPDTEYRGALDFVATGALERGDMLVPGVFVQGPIHLALFMLADSLSVVLDVVCGPVRSRIENFRILRCLNVEDLVEASPGKGTLIVLEVPELRWPYDDLEMSRLLVFSESTLVARAVVVTHDLFAASRGTEDAKGVGEPEAH